MARHEYYKKQNIFQIRLQNYLPRKGITCRIYTNNILFTGMMRGASKTYNVFDFLLNDESWMAMNGAKIYYVTRVVGDAEEEENKGTFYDTEKTIRTIEKGLLYKHTSPFKICMIAGEMKICQEKVNLEKSGDKKKEYRQLILCEECNYKKKLSDKSDELLNTLQLYNTLRPYDTRKLAKKYRVCPKVIQKYYAKNIADIVFITYAMLPFWKQPRREYPFVIFDEARHFMALDDIPIAEFKSKNSTKPSKEECIKAICEKFIPTKYRNQTDQPEWYKKILDEIDTFSEFISGKIKAMYMAAEFVDEYDEEDMKIKFEYKPRLIIKHKKEFPPGVFYGIRQEHFLNDYIKNLSEEKIHINMHELARLLINSDIDKIEELEIRKTIDFLNDIQKIAGCSRTEIEIIRQDKLETDSYKYTINLKPFKRLPKLKGVYTFYLEGTPYPKEFYKYWIGIEKTKIDVITLPSETKVVILYENVKRSTKEIYHYGDKSDPFKRHLKLIKELKYKINEIGLKSTIVARTKEINKMLGSNEVKAEFVCGDKAGEGVQLETDVLILEGTQIRNIGVDTSRRFELARYSKHESPKDALQEFQNIATLQTMVQSVFRGVDRVNKRRNIIVLLGNMMPFGDKCWIELAKQYWPYLNNDNVKYVAINGRQGKDNEIKEIMAVICNKEYDYSISPYENQIIRYVKGRPYGLLKTSTLVSHFLQSPSIIKRSKPLLLKTIKHLIETGHLVVSKEGFIQYSKATQ